MKQKTKDQVFENVPEYSGLLKLPGEIGDVGDSHRGRGALNLHELLESRGLSNRLGVLVRIQDHALAQFRRVLPDQNGRSRRILLDVVRKVDKRRDLVLGRRWVVGHDAAPEVAALERVHVEAGDDTEVVRAALERLEQIGVLLAVGVDQLAGREHDFKVLDIVADHAGMAGVERVSAYKPPGQF